MHTYKFTQSALLNYHKTSVQAAVDVESYLEGLDFLSLYEMEHVLPVERCLFPVDIQRATGKISYFMVHFLSFLFRLK